MKKQIFTLIFMLMFSSGLFADGLKIGFVNMKRLLSEAPQIEKINKKLQKRFNEPKKELEDMADTIRQMEKDFKRDQLMMTESKLTKNKENLIEKVKQFRELEARLGKELQTVQSQELAVFRNIVTDVLNKLAKKEKYDLIMNDGVMYADKALDITDKMLAELKKSK